MRGHRHTGNALCWRRQSVHRRIGSVRPSACIHYAAVFRCCSRESECCLLCIRAVCGHFCRVCHKHHDHVQSHAILISTRRSRPSRIQGISQGQYILCVKLLATIMCADFSQDLDGHGLPNRCVIIGSALPLVILWINFVSGVGFQAIVSQVTMSLMITYFLVFACSLDSRVNRPELLGSKRKGFWQPGRSLGIFLDSVAIIFLFMIAILCW